MALFFHLYGSWSDSAAEPHLITIRDAPSRRSNGWRGKFSILMMGACCLQETMLYFILSGTVDWVAPAVAIRKVLLCSLHIKAPRFSSISLHSLPPPLLSTWLFGHPRCLLYHTPSNRVANQDAAFFPFQWI